MPILDDIIEIIQNFFFPPEKESLHGSADWGTDKERKKLFNLNFSGKSLNNGLVINGISRISKKHSYLHAVVVAPSGAGKTSTYIVPNVVKLTDSMFITDPSGEIHNGVVHHLKHIGFDVRVINPNDISNTFFYNPLERANTTTKINKIADILINNAYEPNSSSNYWNDGAKTILSVIIRVVKNNSTQTKRNLEQVRNLLLQYGQLDPINKTDKLVSECLKWLDKTNDRDIIEELKSFYANEKKQRDSFISVAKNALKIFADKSICELTNQDTIAFEDIKNDQKPPVAIFLIVPEQEIKYYSFLLNLFYSQVFSFCSNQTHSQKSVYFLLDEFGNMGRIPNFETIITTLRKRNCSISIILQDIKQLDNIYGKNSAEIIFGNCASKIFFGGLDTPMCEKIEKLLGRETREYTNKDTDHTSLHARYLMTADEIRRLERDKIIYVFRNQRPFLLNTQYIQI